MNKAANILFVAVEDRTKGHVEYCNESVKLAKVHYVQLTSVDGGPRFNEFERIYKHFSPNTERFEIICFRRYFVLEQYLLENAEIEDFVLIDSDTLLFRGVEEHIRKIASNEEYFSGSMIQSSGFNPRQVSPHFSYWSRKGLMDFVSYIIKTYSSESGIADLEAHWVSMRGANIYGGISDMTLLYNWSNEIGSMNAMNRILDRKVLDHNVTIGHNAYENEYETFVGFKRIFFKKQYESDGTNVYFRTNNGEYIQCVGIHCQGRSKLLMRDILSCNSTVLILKMFGIKMARLVKTFFPN